MNTKTQSLPRRMAVIARVVILLAIAPMTTGCELFIEGALDNIAKEVNKLTSESDAFLAKMTPAQRASVERLRQEFPNVLVNDLAEYSKALEPELWPKYSKALGDDKQLPNTNYQDARLRDFYLKSIAERRKENASWAAFDAAQAAAQAKASMQTSANLPAQDHVLGSTGTTCNKDECSKGYANPITSGAQIAVPGPTPTTAPRL